MPDIEASIRYDLCATVVVMIIALAKLGIFLVLPSFVVTPEGQELGRSRKARKTKKKSNAFCRNLKDENMITLS